MSAEIPWTVGPGETLPKAPPPACTCGSGAHPRHCSAHPWAFGEHVAEVNAPEAEAKPEGEPVYTQAQWDELALGLQRVRGEAVYWQEQATHWKALAEGGR